MNKQQLSEALGWYDSLPQKELRNEAPEVAVILAAARLVERLLPGVCGYCEGQGWLTWNAHTGQCPLCNGSGRVWDEGIVEAVAKAISLQLTGDRDSQFAAPAIARAVLSALVELLTEKAER